MSHSGPACIFVDEFIHTPPPLLLLLLTPPLNPRLTQPATHSLTHPLTHLVYLAEKKKKKKTTMKKVKKKNRRSTTRVNASTTTNETKRQQHQGRVKRSKAKHTASKPLRACLLTPAAVFDVIWQSLKVTVAPLDTQTPPP